MKYLHDFLLGFDNVFIMWSSEYAFCMHVHLPACPFVLFLVENKKIYKN